MRTIAAILFALTGLHAFATEVRVAPPAEVLNGNGSAPLAGVFLPHSSALPASLTLPAVKVASEPKKPTWLVVIGEGRGAEVAGRPLAERTLEWRPVPQGFVAELTVQSPGASALRVALAFEGRDDVEIRVGSSSAWSGDGAALVLGPDLVSAMRDGNDGPLWTPVTSGDAQVIQLVSLATTAPGLVRVVNVSHLWADPALETVQDHPKFLAACQQNYSCATDATVKESGKAVARLTMTYADGSSAYCSGSLLNDRGSTGTPWFTTAAHCLINTQAVASSLQFYWFYETACNGTGVIPTSSTTVGSQLLLWSSDIDFNFLKVTGPLPSGVVRLGWSTDEMANGTPLFGVHHPSAHTKAYSLGSKVEDQTVSFAEPGFTFDVYSTVVHWTLGITEQGSSGSPLMTSDGSYRGTLSAGPINQSCSVPSSFTAFYAKFTSSYPRIKQWIDPSTSTADDRPDSPGAVTTTLPASGAHDGVLNSATDQDWFKFSISEPGVWLVYSTSPSGSATDTFGRIYLSDGATLVTSNDDDPTGSFGTNFLMGAKVNQATTVYVQVTGAAGATGPYVLNTLFIPDDDHSGFLPLGSPLAPTGTATGTINPAGDSDGFVITIASAGTLSVESSGSTDLVGRLYDANLRLVAENDDIATNNLNFRLQASVVPGKYYLKVVAYDVATVGAYSIRSTFTPLSGGAGNAKTLGSRATVSPTRTLYGGFEVTSQSLVYILVRGNSLGTLGVTQAFLDAPRVRLYNAQGQDIIIDQGGRPGFNTCSSTVSSATPVVTYYQNTRGQPVNSRDACIAQTLAPGAYTFSVTPSIPGVTTTSTTSAPDTGEVLFEVVLGGGSGAAAKTLGSRATVTGSATMYGGFEISQAMKVYILVRGNSLGTLGVTQAFLDAPRVRFYDAQGHDLLSDTSGNPGFNFCMTGNTLQQPVLDFYRLTRGQPADSRDGCVSQSLTPGAYTFSVTPTAGTSASGEVLFEVTLGPP